MNYLQSSIVSSYDEQNEFYATPNKNTQNYYNSINTKLWSQSTSDSVCTTPNTPNLDISNDVMDFQWSVTNSASNHKGQNGLGNISQKITANVSYPKKMNNSDTKQISSDRFIPSRKSSKLSIAFTPIHENLENIKPTNKNFKKNNDECLTENCLSVTDLYKYHVLEMEDSFLFRNKDTYYTYVNKNILRYQDPLQAIDSINKQFDSGFFQPSSTLIQNSSSLRKIPKIPFKVLDAPALQDDFYLNLIDWSTQNILAVGLSSCVYLWSAQTSRVTKLCDLGTTNSVTSVNWAPRGPHISIGTNTGEVQIWDCVKLKKVRSLNGHGARVGTLAWNSSILASGSRDKNILLRDIRVQGQCIQKLVGHKQEVCGLKWSFDESQLSSGGNDNKLFVWSTQSSQPILKFTQHTAAVKALAWSPHQHGLLVSGGGTADRTIRYWNTLTNQQLDCIDTGSQVCNLMFSKNVNELISTHGYSLNQIILWKYPTMEKVATLVGHTYRVLYLAMSPDGQTIVTGAGDETLRFWSVFPSKKGTDIMQLNSQVIPEFKDIR